MWFRKTTLTLLMGTLAAGPMIGCENLPGDEKQQGAVIGGVGGAIAGAAVAGKEDRALGALIGGALGAGGGYLIGAQRDKMNDEKDRDAAVQAAKEAERNPAKVEDVAKTKSADINEDGFVTLDEVVAMEKADLSDREMIRRLERTQQYFELSGTQEDYLREHGVSDRVITAMTDMNPEANARLASDKEGQQRISRNPD
jgi:hypothetical protein